MAPGPQGRRSSADAQGAAAAGTRRRRRRSRRRRRRRAQPGCLHRGPGGAAASPEAGSGRAERQTAGRELGKPGAATAAAAPSASATEGAAAATTTSTAPVQEDAADSPVLAAASPLGRSERPFPGVPRVLRAGVPRVPGVPGSAADRLLGWLATLAPPRAAAGAGCQSRRGQCRGQRGSARPGRGKQPSPLLRHAGLLAGEPCWSGPRLPGPGGRASLRAEHNAGAGHGGPTRQEQEEGAEKEAFGGAGPAQAGSLGRQQTVGSAGLAAPGRPPTQGSRGSRRS